MFLTILGCLALGYAFGNFSTAYIIGRLNNIDIREYGSGNAGTTNTLRTLGKKAGILTFIGDILKAIIPVLLIKYLFRDYPDYAMLYAIYTGFGVVLGHNFPAWLNFKGGKGIAATYGVFLSLHPITALVCFVIFAVVVLVSKYVSLGSIIASIIADIWIIIFIWQTFPETALHCTVMLLLYLALALWRHKSNIIRLMNGTENKIGKKKTSTVEDEKSVFSFNKKPGEPLDITVLGAGTWGTALAIQLSKNGHNVTIWSAVAKEVEDLAADRKHIKNLPEAELPENIKLTSKLEEALSNYDFIVSAVASPFVRATAHRIAPIIKPGSLIVDVAKGIEESTLMTLSQVINDEIPSAVVAVLSGPTHAEEVSRGIPTTIVAGAKSRKIAEFIQDAFMSDSFRVYTSPDVLGIEIGAALKNIIALAAGIADGLGYGDNSKAALMTRGLTEISRLGVKLGGYEETFYGLSGIGDMIVTCTSHHSRNRNAGELIGQGLTLEETLKKVGQVVEGVNCAKAAKLLAEKHKVDVPIVEQINLVLFENKPAHDAVKTLFARDKKTERDSIQWKE